MNIFKLHLQEEQSYSPRTGVQTEITPYIKEVSEIIPGEGLEFVVNAGKYIHEFSVIEAEGPDFSRSADKILSSYYYGGPHEAGVAYAALLRAKGMDVTYIQTIDREEVRALSKIGFFDNARVYLNVRFDGYTLYVDSMTGDLLDYLPNEMVPIAQGLDAWDIGLREGFSDLRNLFINNVISGEITSLNEDN